MANYNFFITLLLACSPSVFKSDEIYSLKSVSMAFRHGDRTPQAYPTGFYPNDPYINDSFEPYGHSALTNEGKKREYQIGEKLRERYNAFLGDTFKPSEISVVSTSTERTKMSLLLVLAGLYPPKGKQVWKDELNWQPIPIDSIPYDLQSYMHPPKCPIYVNELKRVKNSTEYKKDLSRFNELMKNLTVFTGREIDDIKIVYHLYHTLTAESSLGLALPEWTKLYFPNGLIRNATLFEYKTESYTPKLIRLNGGTFIRKIMNDLIFEKRLNSTKLNLYSAHEDNIAGLLYALGAWKNEIPAYGSGIVFELHERNSKNYIRILHYMGVPAEFKLHRIPGCAEFCAIEDFMSILKDVIPDDVMVTCFGPPESSLLIPKGSNPIIWLYEKIKSWFNL
ncbi:venom acid phosphatase Acph-1-like [Phymastichus coffea]|uniref:venom acid phosphatase Acph-1-like n=1 Tax=Phymastichus coffea TaxID=108790 RepID=UPI00273CF352|nr:venom acid phosphatase Acph-1-like [Phymastichus coffea]